MVKHIGFSLNSKKSLSFGAVQAKRLEKKRIIVRMSDMIHDFLTVFALIASSIVKKVLEDNTALLQEVSTSSFPKVGHPPVVHQATQNLAIKKHAVRHWGVETSAVFPIFGGFSSILKWGSWDV